MLMPVTAAMILMTLKILPRMMIRMRRMPMIALMPQYCNNDNKDIYNMKIISFAWIACWKA